MNKLSEKNQWFLGIIVTILIFGALKVTQPVSMPAIFALFLVILAWPLQLKLEKHIPGWLAFIVTFLIFLLILAFFATALAISGNIIAEKIPEYASRIDANIDDIRVWARANDLPLFKNISGDSLAGIFTVLREGFLGVYSFISFTSLVLIILLFGLYEIFKFRDKLEFYFKKDKSEKILNRFSEIAGQFQRYIKAKTLISGLTGIFVGVFSAIFGLDFAFIWGLTAFLLNYIPSLGSIIATILISIFAFFQFVNIGNTLLTFFVIGGIQLFFGNWLEPRLQGKYLSISPLVVVLSVIFWGWLWGIPGALLGVPLTIGIINALENFQRTRPIAAFLSDVPKKNIDKK